MSTGLALSVLMCGLPAAAGEALLGSPDFRLSPEQSIGWRGDGSGKYPAATPPLRWERAAKTVKQLRSQATKPKEGETGKPIPDGVIREWLVIGPISTNNEQGMVKSAAGGLELGPDAGEKAGDISWKKTETDSALLDFSNIFGPAKPKTDLAFAHAYVYSETKVKVRLVKEVDGARGGNSVKVLVNGKPADTGAITLEKGWNSLLLRVPCGEQIGPGWQGDKAVKKLSWFVQPIMYGTSGCEYTTENILWTARVPGWSIAVPVIAGDKIFVLGDRRTLSCIEKSSGKILWARTVTLSDAATEEERAKNPEIFKQIAPMAARLAELDKVFSSGTAVTGNAIGEKCDLETKIDALMRQVDKIKYTMPATGEGGYAPRTPVTDGRNICVNYHPCLTVCYDLDGKMKWIHNSPILYKGETHGWYSSPRIIAGKVIVNAEQAIALEVGTGKVAWQFPNDTRIPVLAAKIDNQAVAFLGGPVRNAASGELLFRAPASSWSASVVDGNILYSILSNPESGRCEEVLSIARLVLPKPEIVTNITVSIKKLVILQRLETCLASPLYHDGLVYIVDADGILSVVDAVKHELVYQKYLDLDNGPGGVSRGALGGSPALAGSYIYIFGNQGTCLVIEPGRAYKQAAKNRVEFICQDPGQASWNYLAAEFPYVMIGGLEQSISCPVFEGTRMYYRGTANLYCIEEK